MKYNSLRKFQETFEKNHLALYEVIFQHASDGIHIVDSQGFLVEASAKFCEMLGYEKSEILGLNITDWDHDIDREKLVNELIPSFFTSKHKSEFVTKHVRKNGTAITVEVTTNVIQMGNQKFLYCSSRDISERLKRDEEVKNLMHFSNAVLENSPVGMVIFEVNGPCVLVNQSMSDILKIDRNVLKSMNFRQIKSWQESGLLDLALKAIASGERTQEEVKVHTTAGRDQYLLATIEAVEVEKRNYIICHFQDQTEKIVNIGRLQESQKTLQTIFDYSPLPFLFYDEAGIVDCNFAAVKILGGKKKREILRCHPALFSPEFQPDGSRSSEKSEQMDVLAQQQGMHVFEWTHRRFDGTEFLAEATLVPLKLGNKTVFLTLWRDLTALKESQQKLLESSKMAALGEMSAGIAHEINNPLMVINGKLAQIQRRLGDQEPDREKIQQDLTKIHSMIERISKIIRGLKSFTRKADQDPMSSVKVGQVIQETVELCKEKFSAHHIELRLKINSDSSLECRSTEISQVILNLLSNSHDAVETMPEKWVELEVLDNVGQLKISVTDSGGGIPPAILKKLMQPFYTTKASGKGTGLGLSISKGIIEAHHGSLKYDSSSKNTRFVIELPLSQPKNQSKSA